jgi:hypothetical protein
VSLQPDRISLSGSIQLSLALEGPSPLHIELPKEPEKLLTSESATVWHIRPLGAAKVVQLDGGRERWEQTYRLSPFVPGEKVTIAFAPLKVTAGAELNPQEITFPSKEVRVQTAISEPKPENARPVTGIEELPTIAPPPPEAVGWQFIAALGAIFASVLIAVLIRKSRAKPALAPPREWAARELDRLERDYALERITGVQAADRLAAVLREFIERHFSLPARKLTTAELLSECGRAGWPAERVEPLGEILERCDRAKFAGDAPESAEMMTLLNRSREWIAGLGLPPAAGL